MNEKDNEILKAAINSNNKDIVELVLKNFDLKTQDAKKAPFQSDLRKVLELLDPVSDLSLNTIQEMLHEKFCGSNCGYRVETLADEKSVGAILKVFHVNGCEKNWSHIELPVKAKDGQNINSVIQETITKARLMVLINGFNLVKGEKPLDTFGPDDDTKLSLSQQTQIQFPDTMTGAETEQARESAEENIRILAANRNMQYNDAFRRICLDCGLQPMKRSKFQLKEWQLINRKAKSFLAA